MVRILVAPRKGSGTVVMGERCLYEVDHKVSVRMGGCSERMDHKVSVREAVAWL